MKKLARFLPLCCLAVCLAANPVLAALRSISPAGSGQVPGTATNDSANAGNVGEILSASVLSGAAVGMASGTPVNLASLSLTPGDWDVSCQPLFLLGTTTNVTFMAASISPTISGYNQTPGNFNQLSYPGSVLGNVYAGVSVGPSRISLSATTTYYCVVNAGFTVSTMSVWGILRARRVR